MCQFKLHRILFYIQHSPFEKKFTLKHSCLEFHSTMTSVTQRLSTGSGGWCNQSLS